MLGTRDVGDSRCSRFQCPNKAPHNSWACFDKTDDDARIPSTPMAHCIPSGPASIKWTIIFEFPVPQRGTACVSMKLKRLTGERPSTVLAWHRVAEGNCVAERRGGEQPKANLSSQSSQTRQLNPIRPFGMASLRVKGEALALSLPEAITKHDHTIAKDSDGVWDEKAGKADQLSVEILPGATESGEEVRALIVALKRVTTVEPRGVGR